MFLSNDYATMTLDELVSEEKRMKSKPTAIKTALFIGFLVGIACWSATHKGGFILTFSLLLFAGWIGGNHSKQLKSIRAEINRRAAIGE